MAHALLAPFDRSREFVAIRAFDFRGHGFAKGEDFPTAEASTRTLRLLFETRAIGYKGDSQMEAAQPIPTRQPERLRQFAPPTPRPADPSADDAPLDSDAQRQQFELHHTKPQLAEILRRHGVEIGRRWTKTEMVAEIARARYGSARR